MNFDDPHKDFRIMCYKRPSTRDKSVLSLNFLNTPISSFMFDYPIRMVQDNHGVKFDKFNEVASEFGDSIRNILIMSLDKIEETYIEHQYMSKRVFRPHVEHRRLYTGIWAPVVDFSMEPILTNLTEL